MNYETFISSLSKHTAPEEFSLYLQSLRYDGKNDWNRAHSIIQDLEGNTAARIHAYLHRKEGDKWNADYWYTKAGEPMPAYTLEHEWEELVKSLL